jgi:hypothetical protein
VRVVDDLALPVAELEEQHRLEQLAQLLDGGPRDRRRVRERDRSSPLSSTRRRMTIGSSTP